MKQAFIRLLTCLLAILLLAAPLTACTGGEGNESDTQSESVSVSETESETEKEIAPETPNPIDLLRLGGTPISEFSVVYPADMPTLQKTALDEMVSWIAQSTGVTLPTIPMDPSDAPNETAVEPVAEHMIVIGQNVRENEKLTAAVAEIKNDGYALVMDEGDLYISASTGRGVVYGMFDFLKKYLDIRFYNESFAVMGEHNIVDVPADLKDVFSPAFAIREISLYTMTNFDYFWSHENRGDLTGFGDDLYVNSNSQHTFMGLYNGYPSIQSGGFEPLPCLTDEAVYQTMLTNVRTYLRNFGVKPDSLQLGQSDGVKGCSCDNCAAVDERQGCEGGAYFEFINRLAGDLEEEFPDTKLFIFSYAWTHTPPEHLKFHKNVMVCFCMDESCFSHALDDPDCAINQAVMAEIDKWLEQCDHVTVWDYAYNCSAYEYLDPDMDLILNKFRVLADRGLYGFAAEYPYHSVAGEFENIQRYLREQVLWNPYMTEEEFAAMKETAFRDFYGAAAPLMQEYLDRTTQNISTPGYWMDGNNLSTFSGCTAWYFPQSASFAAYNADGSKNMDFTHEMMGLWREALSLDLTDVQRAHVEYSSMHFYNWVVSFSNSRDEKQEAGKRLNEYKKTYGSFRDPKA